MKNAFVVEHHRNGEWLVGVGRKQQRKKQTTIMIKGDILEHAGWKLRRDEHGEAAYTVEAAAELGLLRNGAVEISGDAFKAV